MSAVAILLLAVTATTLPLPQPPPAQPHAREIDRTPIRCRPSPYYVADNVAERPRLERIIITGSRIPVREMEKRPRPCLLMRTMDTPSNQHVARVAD